MLALSLGFMPSRVRLAQKSSSVMMSFSAVPSDDPFLSFKEKSARCNALSTNKMSSLSALTAMTFFSSPLIAQADSLSVRSFLLNEESTVGYSQLSLYFTLGLYVLTLPGLYSLVTRSVKTKPIQKVYDIPGPANPTAKPLRQTAAEIMAYFKSMNYEVAAAEEVITFRGVIARSNSQAAFLTFCTFMGLGSLGLVVSTISPDFIGAKAYLLTLLSPYAGLYYWKNAQRVDEVQVKIETSDDDSTTSIIALGGKEDLERFSRTLELSERGKVYIKGIFESDSDDVGLEEGVDMEIGINSDGT